MRGSTGQVSMLAVAVLAFGVARADEPPSGPRWTLIEGDLSEFARRVFKITDVVLDQHLEPPTRQEMLLCRLTALLRGDLPEGLSREVSKTATADDFADCLVRFWPTGSGDAEKSVQLRQTFLYGLGQAVPGGLDFESAKQSAVNRQIAANQYVGIGILIGSSGNGQRHQIGGTFPRGPAAKAGIKALEFIVEIDGVKTDNLSTAQLVERLRGAEGTTVTLGIATDATGEPRLVKLTRSVVPRQTVVGHRQLAPEKWECVLDGDRVGYLNVQEMTASTVSELREYEFELEARNAGYLVLDLRGAHCSELRYAIAVADALLDGGTGFVRFLGGTTPVPLDRDCLFREWPMAVLVSSYTPGYAEWLACLLQQNRRAIVVGQPTTGADRFVLTRIDLPDGWGTMRLATAVLERESAVAGPPVQINGGGSAFTLNSPDSLLFRLGWASRSAFDRVHAVSPDVPVEEADAFKWNPRGSGSVHHSPLVERAVQALTSPVKNESRNRNTNQDD
jgi:C-terminal processing protease CtpA/Prc